MAHLDDLTLNHCPSPNFGDRRNVTSPDMIILHYTDLKDAQTALHWMCDPEKQVSAHFLIAENGDIHQLVPLKKRAWHAGLSFWRGETDINSRSIGIELDNPGHSNGLIPFREIQLKQLVTLLNSLRNQYDIPDRNIIGHSDIAPGRKIDPGPYFPWEWLAQQGHGIWPKDIETKPMGDILPLLKDIGYQGTPADIEAFQLHYRSQLVTGTVDQETYDLAFALRACVAG